MAGTSIEPAGARLLFLLPYSPDFNPTEMACSKLKAPAKSGRADHPWPLGCHRPHRQPALARPSNARTMPQRVGQVTFDTDGHLFAAAEKDSAAMAQLVAGVRGGQTTIIPVAAQLLATRQIVSANDADATRMRHPAS